MRVYRHAVAGDVVNVYVPETLDDLYAFREWLAEANERGPVAVDTETTGLNIYSPGYRLRTVQFGDRDTAWVIHWERGGAFVNAARWALRILDHVLIHNAPFDWLVLDEHAEIPLESLVRQTQS
jgi:DNA polymerase-1